ncbi:DNA (cytosine-5-)-methyltransferase [Micrococcus luteus]|uniref:DNA cytosine methyltransferase n=1 Tax=Micrococcus luteus TaxID=1270 RepID=UPI000BACAE3A|nr:DNA (cytosine-5-)-methyltransferase [Micrococcus luteus]PAW32150.1 DNA (cytosine-5-)-methyltransferase [Micrococcus luteus]
MPEDFRVVEICAGAGGQALGLELAGFEHALAVELDSTAASTLRRNRPQWDVRVGDVADRTVWDPHDYAPNGDAGGIDLFAGGVPCPPFSVAGKQLGASDERDLFAWAIEQVGTLQPRAVLLENVKGLSQAKFAAYRQHVLDRLWGLGYEAEWKLINAADYGVAQLRPRFVLVAMQPEDFRFFHWPTPSGENPTVGTVLHDLMAKDGWEGADAWAEDASSIGPTIVGGSKKHGGADLGPTRAKQAWARLGVDGRGVADAAPNPGDEFEIGPRLTLDMVKRLQGWHGPEYSWEFEGRKTSVYRQIGNAFPPPVARALGEAILNAFNRVGDPRPKTSMRVDADTFVKVLKSVDGYVEAGRLARLAGFRGDESGFDSRIAALSQSYEVEAKVQDGKQYYKIGSFRAFLGQKNHVRNLRFEVERSRIS